MFKKLKTTIITFAFLLIISLSHFIAYPLFAKIALKPIVNFEDRFTVEVFCVITVCFVLFALFILFGAIKNLILTIISEIKEFKAFLKTRELPNRNPLDPIWETRQNIGINTSTPSSLFTDSNNLQTYIATRHDPMPEPEWVKVYQNTQEELNKKIQVDKPPKNNKLKFLTK